MYNTHSTVLHHHTWSNVNCWINPRMVSLTQSIHQGLHIKADNDLLETVQLAKDPDPFWKVLPNVVSLKKRSWIKSLECKPFPVVFETQTKRIKYLCYLFLPIGKEKNIVPLISGNPVVCLPNMHNMNIKSKIFVIMCSENWINKNVNWFDQIQFQATPTPCIWITL